MSAIELSHRCCDNGRAVVDCLRTAETVDLKDANTVKRQRALVKCSSAAPAKPGTKGLLADVLPKKELERKLHQAVLLARARLGARKNKDKSQ